MSGVYAFSQYDKNLCLKVSPGLWFVILYLLRPFLVWFASLGLGGGAQGVERLRYMIYPDNFSLVLAMLATIPVMIFIYAWSKRSPGAKPLARKLWSNGKSLLTIAAVLNIIVVFVPLLTKVVHSIAAASWLQLGIPVLIIGYLNLSQRVTDTFADFPEEKQAGNTG